MGKTGGAVDKGGKGVRGNGKGERRGIVHPERFRPNAQNAIAFTCRNRPHVNRSGEFAYIYLHLHLRAFASTICDRARARTCVKSHVRACDRAYVNSI